MHNAYSHPTRQRTYQRFEPLPPVPQPGSSELHVITNVGVFAHCRKDSFCRCRKCKPPLQHKGRK